MLPVTRERWPGMSPNLQTFAQGCRMQLIITLTAQDSWFILDIERQAIIPNYGATTTGARQNAAFRAFGSSTVTWQSY